MNHTPVLSKKEAEAATWAARLRADDCSVQDERAFRDWLSVDPARIAAFENINAVWSDLDALSTKFPIKERRLRPAVERRWLLAGIGSLIVASGTIAMLGAAQAKTYKTEVGEQKRVTLSDGTEVFLDSDTKLIVSFDDELRLIDLPYGRANFRVVLDSKRPFEIKAPRTVTVAGRSIFNIQRDGGEIDLVVLAGHASIDGAVNGSGKSVSIVNAGERLTISSSRALVAEKPNLLPLIAWQKGKAIFDNNTLASAVHEMNRYSVIQLEVADPRIANMKVSGIYSVGDSSEFAYSLARILPISVRRTENVIEIVPAKTRRQ